MALQSVPESSFGTVVVRGGRLVELADGPGNTIPAQTDAPKGASEMFEPLEELYSSPPDLNALWERTLEQILLESTPSERSDHRGAPVDERRRRRYEMAAVLRGTFVEGGSAGMEETTGFNLEDVTVIESNSDETTGFDVEGTTVTLDMPSAVASENWLGLEVEVSGRFEQGEGDRRVFVVESIDEA